MNDSMAAIDKARHLNQLIIRISRNSKTGSMAAMQHEALEPADYPYHMEPEDTAEQLPKHKNKTTELPGEGRRHQNQ